MTDADIVRDGLHPGRETSGNPFEALFRLEARAEQAERERDEWREKYDAEKINWHRLYEDFRAAERERDEAVTAAMAAARLAELDTLALFSAYECEHGLTIAMEHADEDGPVPCWAHDDMRTLHEWLSSRAALAAVSPPQEGEA